MAKNEYITKNIDKILSEKSEDTSLGAAFAAAWVLGHFKGLNLKIFDLREKNFIADYCVVASSTNLIQAKSMAEEIVRQFHTHGKKFISKEGMDQSEWVLLDSGDVIVHIFQESSRPSYDLEELWKDSKIVEIPSEYYNSDDPLNNSENSKDYF